ncbi:MAG: hypothetical protein E7270_10055 [Lachnospiraceae bacterium]|nr:hypothetical protein [Lachnospiraceae bacterium]
MMHILEHTIKDVINLLPFLFITYLVMEYIEHKTGAKFNNTVKKAGKVGPLFGGLLGVFPQCGFSTAASGLYAGRVITVGTLISIYLSTSDEMLPIMISEKVEIIVILKILGLKMLIGILCGFLVDLCLSKFIIKKEKHEGITHLCHHDHCHCEKGIFKSSVKHTLQVFLFIFLITLVLNLIIHHVGEDEISKLILDKAVIGPILAGLVGLIPNCAASVVITQLYLSNVISFGSMLAGLLVGAGVGVLVLFRVNSERLKENVKIVSVLYICGVIAGILIDLLGVTV